MSPVTQQKSFAPTLFFRRATQKDDDLPQHMSIKALFASKTFGGTSCATFRCPNCKIARFEIAERFAGSQPNSLKCRRVTIRGAQPSARLSEEICLSEGSAGVSPRVLQGLSGGSAGLCGVLRGSVIFSRFFGGSSGTVGE